MLISTQESNKQANSRNTQRSYRRQKASMEAIGVSRQRRNQSVETCQQESCWWQSTKNLRFLWKQQTRKPSATRSKRATILIFTFLSLVIFRHFSIIISPIQHWSVTEMVGEVAIFMYVCQLVMTISVCTTDKCTNDRVIPTKGYRNWCSAFLSIIKSDVFWDSGVDEPAYPWEQDVITDKITSEIKLILVKPLKQTM